MAFTQLEISELYVATFNRAPDAAGLAYWMGTGTPATTATTVLEVANAMLASEEMAATYPSTQTTTEFVEAMYQNLFGRAAEQAGLDYWVGQIDTGAVAKESMIKALIEGAQANTTDEGKADAAILDNKAAVGVYFAEQGLSDTTDAATVLEGVTADTATVTTAEAAIDAMLGTPGETFALTTGTDTITGTENDDTVTGLINTLTANDKIEDASTTDNDTLSVELVANVDNTTTITNIENLNFDVISGQRNVDMANITGVKVLSNDGSSGALTLTNINDLDTVYEMKSSSGNMTFSTFTTTAVASTLDTLKMNINGDVTGAIIIGQSGIETLDISSDGNSINLSQLNTNGTTTLNIQGGSDFTLGTASSLVGFTTIDARTAGTFTSNLTQAATGTAILTSSGNDAITLLGAVTANDGFYLGEGTDKLTTTVVTAAGVAAGAIAGATAIYNDIESIDATVATALNMQNSNSKSDFVFTNAAAGAIEIMNMKSGSTVEDNALSTTVKVGFASSVVDEVFNLDMKTGMNGVLAVANVKDLTVTIGGAAAASAAAGGIILDSNNTNTANATFIGDVGSAVVTDLKIVNNASGTALGAITASNGANTSAVSNITIDDNAGLTLTTMIDINKLQSLTVDSDGVTVMGALGATNASTVLDTIDLNNNVGTLTMGAIAASNAAGISKVDIDSTGGAVTFAAAAITNTSGDIGTVTITGENAVTVALTAATSGIVHTVNALSNTGGLTSTITNATAGALNGTTAGTTVTLGDAGLGLTNTITLAGTNLASSVTGGTGTDIITTTAGADTINGGGGNDNITGGLMADKMTGGTGADNFNISTAVATVTESGVGGTAALMAASHDVITDFSGVTGGQLDTITIDLATATTAVAAAPVAGTASITAQAASGTGGLATFAAADDTLAEQITAVSTALAATAAGEAAVWVNGSNTYMYVSDGVLGVSTADVLIELTGVQATAGFTTDATGLIITDIA